MHSATYLGRRYCYYGEAVVMDEVKAVEWYTKAAEKGHSESQFRLASCYEDGAGRGQSFKVVHECGGDFKGTLQHSSSWVCATNMALAGL